MKIIEGNKTHAYSHTMNQSSEKRVPVGACGYKGVMVADDSIEMIDCQKCRAILIKQGHELF